MSSKPTGLNRQPPALPSNPDEGSNRRAAKSFQGNSRTRRQNPPLGANRQPHPASTIAHTDVSDRPPKDPPPLTSNTGTSTHNRTASQGNSRTLRHPPPLTSKTGMSTDNRTASQGNSRTRRQNPPLGANRQPRTASTIALTKNPPPITHLQHQKKQKPSRGRSETSNAVDDTIHLVTVQQNLEWEINTQAALLNQNHNFVEARGGEVPNYGETMQIIGDKTSAQLEDARNFTSHEIELRSTANTIVSNGNENLQVVAEHVQENGASAINFAVELIEHISSCIKGFCEDFASCFCPIE